MSVALSPDMHGTCYYPRTTVRNMHLLQGTDKEEKPVKVEIANYRKPKRKLKCMDKKYDKTCSYNSYIKHVVFGNKKISLGREEGLQHKMNEELVGEGITILKMNENKPFNLDLLHQIVGLFDSIQTSNGENLFKLAEQIEEIKSAIYPEGEGEVIKVKEKVKAVNNSLVNSVLDTHIEDEDYQFSFKLIGRKLLSVEEIITNIEEEEDEEFTHEELALDIEKHDIDTHEKDMIESDEIDDYDASEDEENEEHYDYDTVDDFDLLDEESLTSMLADYDDISEKLKVIEELIDTLEAKIVTKDDKELQTSAVQSLIVYLYAMEDLKPKVENASSKDKENFKNLNVRLNTLKETQLRLVTHFETFVEKAWSLFIQLLDENVIQEFKRNDVIDMINKFVFNFHYASEIEKMVISRDIPDEVDMIEGGSEDIRVMTKFYRSLGVEPEVHDEGYFSQALKGFVSDGEEDELDIGFQSRNLLSVKNEEEDISGHCSKDDPECGSEDKSVFSEVSTKSISTTLPPKVSTTESLGDFSVTTRAPLRGLAKCEDFLARTEEFSNKPAVLEDDMGKMGPKQKIKSIKHFLSQMKKSQKMLEEYKSIQESIEDPQDYRKCHKMLKVALAAIQSQASNTKWMGHLTSLMASNDPQILNQLNEILTPKNKEEDEQNQFQSRKLLSIEEPAEQYCEQNNEDCGSPHENLYLQEDDLVNDKLQESTSSHKNEKLVNDLKKELDDALKVSKNPRKSESPTKSKSPIERCQYLLVNSRKYLTATRKDKTFKEMQSMNPKQKVKALKSFMTRMTKSKELLDEYQDITLSMKDHSDIQLCQPVLKEAMENLSEIQAHAGNTGWMGQMSSLLESNDPDVLSELNDIMATKMN